MSTQGPGPGLWLPNWTRDMVNGQTVAVQRGDIGVIDMSTIDATNTQRDTVIQPTAAYLPDGIFCLATENIAAGATGRWLIRGYGYARVNGAVAVTDDLSAVAAQDYLDQQTGSAKVIAKARVATTASGLTAVDFDGYSGVGVVGGSQAIFGLPIQLATVTAGDVMTDLTLGFTGTIDRVAFVNTVAVTTAAKLASLVVDIGATEVTGGLVALTSANQTPLGVVIAGTAITAGNAFGPTDTISVRGESVTAFAEGAGVLYLFCTIR